MSRQQVEIFLKEIGKRIADKQYDFTYKDMKELTRLGISITEAVQIVKELSIENYYRGPTCDHRYADQEIYEFGKIIDGIEIYIKLTVRRKNDLFIMSFHEAKKPINYRFKKKGR